MAALRAYWQWAVKDSSSNKLTEVLRIPTPQCRYEAKGGSKRIGEPAPVNVREVYLEKWPCAVKCDNNGAGAVSMLR